jgi:phage shock protein PspC (stress-responsive transcriptional regulator)
MAKRRLYKIESEKMISGVCAGIADYFDVDISIVRIVWALLGFSGGGILLYIIAAVVLPDKNTLTE